MKKITYFFLSLLICAALLTGTSVKVKADSSQSAANAGSNASSITMLLPNGNLVTIVSNGGNGNMIDIY